MGLATVIFSNIRSDLLEHRHHHVANWRRQAGPTVWVDTLGSRNPRLRDFRRVLGEGAGQSTGSVLPGVTVVKPGGVPLHGSKAIYGLNRRALESRLRAVGVQPERTLAWVYLAHPVVAQVLRRHPWGATVFDLVDDVSDMELIHPNVLTAERELIGSADVVFATSHELERKAAAERDGRVHYVPNAVDAARFAGVPPRTPGVRRLGYIGSVFEWFDEELVAAVARARPDLEFRVVGPVRRSLALLERLPNVEIAGPIPASRVPEELAALDLCIIPFRPGPLTAATDPLKVYEALAAGRPVLATGLVQAERFAPAVRLAESADDWLAAIEQLETGSWSFDVDATRRRIAEQEDWRQRFSVMDRVLDEALA